MPNHFDAARLAQDIVIRFARFPDNRIAYGPLHAEEMTSAITAALLEARKAPEGHVIDERGVVRKVLGQLPITPDGCVPCLGSVIWHPVSGAYYPVPGLNVAAKVYGGSQLVNICDCYSTREAAEAAKDVK